MKNIILKEIEKITLFLALPCTILLLVLFNEKPAIAVAYLIGLLLGVFRLKTLFNYITGILAIEDKQNASILMGSYIFSLFMSFAVLGFTLYKVTPMGIAILFGLITVPIIVTVYSVWKGVSLYRSSK